MTTLTIDRAKALLAQVSYEKARRNFLDFLPFVKVMEPPPGRGVIPFEAWPHLIELATAFGQYRLIIVAKSKQIGISWLLAAHDCWTAAYHPGANVLQFSKGLLESTDLLAKSAFVYEHLPPELQPKAEILTGVIKFPQIGSRILALPSTVDAGIGQTGTKVTMDEADFHDYLEANYDNAAKPTIDAGGQLIMVSTINPEKVGSPFQRWVKGAGWQEPGENGFALFFYPWHVRPGRDQAWYEATLAQSMEPQKHTKNYPGSLEEALAPAKGVAYFDSDMLLAMLDDCREPIEVRDGGLVRVWRKPVVAGKYVAGGDCAWGEKGAYSVLTIEDWQTGDTMAQIYGRPHLDEVALANVKLCKEYNEAFVGIEDNGEGTAIVKKMRELGYGARMYCRTPGHPKAEERSWHTDSGTRPVMLGELAEDVRMRRFVIRDRAEIMEFMSFIRTEAGRPEAAQGSHDDFVMARAIVRQMRHHAHFRMKSRMPAQPYFV